MMNTVIEKITEVSDQLPRDLADSADYLMPIEAVQKILNRSRASVYRYANTDPSLLNLPFEPNRLNPEPRQNKEEALQFHPNEVARFAREVLGMKQVTIEVTPPPETATTELLREILNELKAIRKALDAQ
ncbi:MAG: resolvase [Cyanobacteria bacterium J06632_22]